MKSFRFSCLMLTILSLHARSQSSSPQQHIATFCKVWGFMKYHHPSIAEGKLDWDSVFLQNIRSIKNAGSTTILNKTLETIIDQAGMVKSQPKRNMPDDLFRANQVSTDWFVKSGTLSRSIREKLKFIWDNSHQRENKYIKLAHLTADYSGEKNYEEMGFPDEDHRLLFFSRFWNIINYYAPYKFLAENWETVLNHFIPKIILARDSLSYYKTLQELCKSLKDGHAQLALRDNQSLTDLIFGNYMIPFYCQIVDEKVVIRKVMNDSIARVSNLQRGDIILKIDNKAIHEIIASRRKHISASNAAGENHQLSRYLLDGSRPSAELLIKRGNKTVKSSITRIPTAQRDWGAFINYTYNDVGYRKVNDSVLIIYAMQIWKGNIDSMKKLISGSKVVIFDVRNYPQNDEFYYITDPFLSKPQTIDYTTIAIPDLPGLFKWNLNENKVGRINNDPFKGKVIILADERTQSQGEYSCMVLQTIPGAITIGRQTAGADGVVTRVPMGGGLTLSYSGYGVYYPDKTQTQGKGIKIDVPVKASIAAIVDGKDEVLEKAFQYINKPSGN